MGNSRDQDSVPGLCWEAAVPGEELCLGGIHELLLAPQVTVTADTSLLRGLLDHFIGLK